MLIDAYEERWLERLRESSAEIRFLLIDGAFLPGLYRRIRATGMEVALLFEALPACSDATRDVSPFLVPWTAGNLRFETLLCECSGKPMVSAISTEETLPELTGRLAAWCVIEADGLRFNFRFSDTRRLPAILETLSLEQRAKLVGLASRWAYIGRDGKWRELALGVGVDAIADRPSLDDNQFARLVSESEADEVIANLEYLGPPRFTSPSHQYEIVSRALQCTESADLAVADKLAWCDFCMAETPSPASGDIARIFEHWMEISRSPESTT